METTAYKANSWPYSIHILGDGPYANEVVNQITYPIGTKLTFLSKGDDDADLHPSMLMLGIAEPSIKKDLIEEFYSKLEHNIFHSSLSSMTVIAQDTWTTIYAARCVNIGPFTSIGLNSKIEDFVGICANVTIGHDCTIAEYSTVCPGAVISGNVHIGKAAFIGAGTIIKDGINIGAYSVVGCGSIVLEDVPHCCVVAGNPARHLRFREMEEYCPT